ncbi:MAG: TspO/MBR family protein, partial [Candidatus Riflebacteria bacterium]
SLNRPPLNPPGWVFGPVWTLLYSLMGISLYLIGQQPDSQERKRALRVFYFQLLLNACWTPAFFGFHKMGLALLILFLLIISIILTIMHFIKIKKSAGLLLIPYVIWCCFAFYLNLGYLILNNR